MTKNERKGMLIGIAFFSFFVASYINELIKQPLYAFIITFMLLILVFAFVLSGSKQYKRPSRKQRMKFRTLPTGCNNEKDMLKKIKRQKIESLRKMQPFEFEEYVRVLLLLSGFKAAKCTPKTNDGGKDIIAVDSEGKRVFVECKRHNETNKIGRPFIQKFHSALIDGNADYGLFVTTSYFNTNAVKYARDKKIELIDARILADMIEEVNRVDKKKV